jgi:hypothetical protein
MKDQDDVHGSRSEFERYESKYGFSSNEPMIDGVPLSKLLATTRIAPPKSDVVTFTHILCSRCKEWTNESDPCCG